MNCKTLVFLFLVLIFATFGCEDPKPKRLGVPSDFQRCMAAAEVDAVAAGIQRKEKLLSDGVPIQKAREASEQFINTTRYHNEESCFDKARLTKLKEKSESLR